MILNVGLVIGIILVHVLVLYSVTIIGELK